MITEGNTSYFCYNLLNPAKVKRVGVHYHICFYWPNNSSALADALFNDYWTEHATSMETMELIDEDSAKEHRR